MVDVQRFWLAARGVAFRGQMRNERCVSVSDICSEGDGAERN